MGVLEFDPEDLDPSIAEERQREEHERRREESERARKLWLNDASLRAERYKKEQALHIEAKLRAAAEQQAAAKQAAEQAAMLAAIALENERILAVRKKLIAQRIALVIWLLALPCAIAALIGLP